MRVIIWTCPTPGCGNYYGSSSARNLATDFNSARDRESFPRSRCPDCTRRGMAVERIAVVYSPVTVGEELAEGRFP
jgi:hypothetical protein